MLQQNSLVGTFGNVEAAGANITEDSTVSITGAKLGKDNLCIDGHLAPEFFLLGAQKGASTSFTVMFSSAPGVVFGQFGCEYESHFFHEDQLWQNGKSWWLSKYPKCSSESRQVAMDPTPNYLAAARKVIPNLHQMYGALIARLNFAVILREPLARAHSAFHYFQNKPVGCDNDKDGKIGLLQQKPPLDGNTVDKQTCLRSYIDGNNSGFSTLALEFISGHDNCFTFLPSNYSHYLSMWFAPENGLSSSQFTLFAFKQVVAPVSGRTTAVERAWHDRGLIAEKPVVVHENPFYHPRIEDEVDKDLLERLKAYIDSSMGARKTAEILLDSNAVLFDFPGPNDVSSMSTWLQTNW